MFNWNQVCETLKINAFANLLIKNAKEITVYMLTALIGSSVLYQFLKHPQPTIPQPQRPNYPKYTDENPPPDTPDSPQGIYKSR